MKKAAFSILLALCSATSWAQSESETAYNFLRLPVGAHAAAIGGDNVSLVEDDENLLFNNPALLASSSPTPTCHCLSPPNATSAMPTSAITSTTAPLAIP